MPDLLCIVQLGPFPEYGVNSYRPEILVTAFADAVITLSREWGFKTIKGNVGPADFPVDVNGENSNFKRILVFSMGTVR